MLAPLGISAEHEALYVVLAPLESATVTELAGLVNAPISEVAQQVQALGDLGLAVEIGPEQWRALPLTDVIKELRARRISELDLAAIAAESLQSRLLAAVQRPEDDIRVVVGVEALIDLNVALLRGAKRRVCIFDRPPYAEVRDIAAEALHEESPTWQVLERGVTLQAIYHPGFDSTRLKELMLFAQQGEKSRTGPVPMKLTIIDEQVALIPSMYSYTPGHLTRAAMVRHPMIVESLQWLFDAVWESAVPIVAASYLQGDPRRQVLVALLMSGSTDEAIANHLAVNVRSVRRWVAELMESLGVASRLQLGAALVRVREVPPSPP